MNKILPFFFESLDADRTLVTNISGEYGVLESRDELEAMAAGNPAPGTIEKLAHAKFIAPDEKQHAAHSSLLASALSHRIKSNLIDKKIFMIVPTLRCDHNCTYCQVSRENIDAQGFDLDVELVPKIAETIVNQGPGPCQIEFQGGEPLVRFDVVKRFYEELESRSVGNSYVIATSLSLLNEAIIDWARDKDVQFSVSMDGVQATHDHSRRNVIGSSHQMASSGIKKIIEEIGPERLGLVTTVTPGLFDTYQLFVEEISHLGFRELFVRPLSPYGFAQKKYNHHYSIDEYFVFYERFIAYLIDNYGQYGISEATFKIHVSKVMNPRYTSYVDLKSPSGYFLNAMVFDYSGKVFGSDEARMIYKTHGVEELVLCDLNDEGYRAVNSASEQILSGSFIFDNPGCDECAYSPYCGSDPMYHIATQGDFVGDKSLSDFCYFQKKIFSLVFTLLSDPSRKSVLERWVYE